MLGFLEKVIANVFAILIALGILTGGCSCLWSLAVKSADEARQRHAERVADDEVKAPADE